MAQNLYNPRVLLGNWNEDLFLEEDLMKDFLEKRDKGQLLIQRSRRLKETLLRPTKLSVSADGFIHFGDQVLLVNPSYEEKEADLFLGGDLSLCMSPDEIQAYLAHGLEVPCGLSAAQTRAPLGRNTFCVLSSSCPVTIGRCNGQLHAHGCRLCPWRHSRPSLVGGRPPGPTPTCGWSMRAPRCRPIPGLCSATGTPTVHWPCTGTSLSGPTLERRLRWLLTHTWTPTRWRSHGTTGCW
ncbi:cilia- and flagella-associated protein 161-like isoform X6 [Sorex fumeus]|uniref:cilia- and flagella-associated protein 161-like isoform X6 n=1 Tax=Sorex fumeus TaxID=62283 RepID=UPI0024ADBE2D|nr:cilia- and flagella-associated protein 161-like isoform X6 [Sorex fumeus]